MSAEATDRSSEEVVYFVAIRTAAPRAGAEVRDVMEALDNAGLLTKPPMPGTHYAVAWSRPYKELTANDNGYLRELGLDFDSANAIVTVASVEVPADA
jgi:hypothetical protein